MEPYEPALYRAEQVRELDRIAIEDFGTDGFELMRRAGRAAFRLLRRHFHAARHLTVLCGGGNNGGDGYVIAALAARQGFSVRCVAVSDPGKLRGAAHQAWHFASDQDVRIESAGELGDEGLSEALRATDVIVDCLLGTGLSGEVRDPYAGVIATINESGRDVMAVDVPSGLCADTGRVLGSAVRAALTITFIGRKVGLYTGQARNHTGYVYFDDLSVQEGVYETGPDPVAWLAGWDSLRDRLPERLPASHKGTFGRVLVIGGDHGMGGAGLLAAEAALRAGSGLVFLATRAAHVPAALARRAEVQARAVEHGNELDELLERVDAVAIGPGLGQSAWGQQMLQRVRNWSGPVVADADAINLVAAAQAEGKGLGNWLLTPHPGEAARLLGTSIGEVEADRFAALDRLVERFQASVLLKGAGSLIGSPGQPVIVLNGGNQGMATAGMGDVLTGIGASLAGQGLPMHWVAAVGGALHARAADIVAGRQGVVGLLAGDVVAALPEAFHFSGSSGELPDE